MVKLEPRNTQTRVKHEILARYLDVWGNIILYGLRNRPSSKSQTWHFVYVDCFSYLGRYAGERADLIQGNHIGDVYGSPIIGIQALDRLAENARKIGLSITVNAILVEEKPSTFNGLKETLSIAGYEKRVVETQKFLVLKNGEIAIVNANSLRLVDDLINYTTRSNTWSFYLIDPYGPSGIPYDFVKKIVSQDRHDVMINWIYEDLSRKAGMSIRNDLDPRHKQLVENWTNAFGNNTWINIARDTFLAYQESLIIENALGDGEQDYFPSTEKIKIEKEQKFVELYRNALLSMDNSLSIKLVRLMFGDRDRTMFYLYLTTHDPTGALALNKILYDGKYFEHELRHELSFAKMVAPPTNQPFLLPPKGELKIPEYQAPNRPCKENIAKKIFEKFKGNSVTRKAIYRELADTNFFSTEVDSALALLRKQGLISYDGKLVHGTLIEFHTGLEL